MSTLADSPSPIKKNPVWNDQVKVGRGYSDGGGWHRALDVAVKMFEAGRWDGRGLLVVNEPYETHRKMPSFIDPGGSFVDGLVEGVDYELASDSVYRREG